MSRMRSFSFPKLGSNKRQDESMSGSGSPYYFAPTHSRGSSGASSSSTPATPTFSSRSHNQWHSSTSSLATTPDSPVNVAKSALHDLVEDPEEREEGSFDIIREEEAMQDDDPLCICDDPMVCIHRVADDNRSTVVASPAPEWMPGDDMDLATSATSFKRRRSGEQQNETFSSRMSRRWPSMSRRLKDPQPLRSTSTPVIHSAPASRSSSLRLRDLKSSLSMQLEEGKAITPPFTPVRESQHFGRKSSFAAPIDVQMPRTEDPVDRQELASTPLLPPMLERHLNNTPEGPQSPLQSPSVAAYYDTFSQDGTPVMTPTIPGLPTPPLSSRPSVASFTRSSATHIPSLAEIPPMTISNDNDPWAARLGHANFQISPEPYFPDVCNLHSCKRLIEDWSLARQEFKRQLAHVTENYGPTSNTFKLTEQKWLEIDATWRANHQMASAQAGVNTDGLLQQTMAEMTPVQNFPVLNDPEQPDKFPEVDDADIVGPMVRYAQIQRQPSKRAGFLKLFTDPASLLGRSAFPGIRR